MFIKLFFLNIFCFQFIESFQPSDVVFKLIRKNTDHCSNPITITESLVYNFNFKSKRTAVIIHGWKPPVLGVDSYKKLCECISKDADNVENIIIVDWTQIAGAFPNATSSETQNLEYTAQRLASILSSLEKNYGLDMQNVDLIGHSLGSYVAGLTGGYLLDRTPQPLSAISNSQINNYDWVSTQISVPKICGVPGYQSIIPALNQFIDCSPYPKTESYHINEALTPMFAKPVGSITALDPAGASALPRIKKTLEKIGDTILEVRREALTVQASLPKINIQTLAMSLYAEYLLEKLPKSVELNGIPASLESSRFSLTGNESPIINQYVSDPTFLGVDANSLDNSRKYGANVVVVEGDHGILTQPHSKVVDFYCNSIKKCKFLSQNINENLGYGYNGHKIGAKHNIKCSITDYNDPKCCKEDKPPVTPSCVPSRGSDLTDKIKQDFNIN